MHGHWFVSCLIGTLLAVLVMACSVSLAESDGHITETDHTSKPHVATFCPFVAPSCRRLSIRLTDVALSRVLKEYNAKATIGLEVRMSSRNALAHRVSIDLKDVSPWTAIGEISRTAHLGLQRWGYTMALGGGAGDTRASDVQGPVLLVLSPDLGGNGKSVARRVFLAAYFDPWDIAETPVVEEVVAVARDGRTLALSVLQEKDVPGASQWSCMLEDENLKSLARLNIRMRAQIRSGFQETTVPLAKVSDSAGEGVSLRIGPPMKTDQPNPKLDCARTFFLEWNDGLSESERVRLHDLAERELSGEAVAPDDVEWVGELKKKMRVMNLILLKLLNERGDEITPFMFEVISTSLDTLSGRFIGHEPQMRSGVLRFVCGEVKEVRLTFTLDLH